MPIYVYTFIKSLSWPKCDVCSPFPAETAVNIAYACNIFEDEMDGMFIVEGKNDETIRQELRYRDLRQWQFSEGN